jgi:hypothetical protein
MMLNLGLQAFDSGKPLPYLPRLSGTKSRVKRPEDK